jgi:EmrB/QacA subfamily drug resistance transporter
MALKSQRTGLVTTILVGAAFLAGLDLFIVNVAFDEIGRDFATTSAAPTLPQLSWVLTAYAVIYAALLVPMGRLTDRYGRKHGFVAGLALFTAASAACGLSTGVWELVLFRGLQAIGAAAMTPASLGLLLAALPAERKAPAARLWALTGALAAALGPAAGGGLVQLSWHWAFFVNVPVGILLVVAAIRYVPDVRHNINAPHPDLTGAALLAVSVGALVLGLVQGQEWGWSGAGVLGAFAVSVLALAAFVRSSRRHASPLLDPALLRVRSFAWINLSTLMFNAGFGASLLGGILWMQQAWDYSALRTGLAVALGPLLVPITSLVAHRLAPHARPSRMIALGCLIAAGSATLMGASLTTTPSYLSSVLPAWALMGVAVGLAMPNMVAAATAELAPEQASTGGGVVTMSRQIGMVLGVTILVAIVGNGAATVAHFRASWLVVAAWSLAAAGAALAMEVRRTSRSESRAQQSREPLAVTDPHDSVVGALPQQ